jgi:hypothetical protein
VDDVRARPRTPSKRFINDDFPTFDLPRNTTFGPVAAGSSSGRKAEHSNRQDVIFNG